MFSCNSLAFSVTNGYWQFDLWATIKLGCGEWGMLWAMVIKGSQSALEMTLALGPTSVALVQALHLWPWGKTPLLHSLVWEDPTCRGAAKLACHHYQPCALKPGNHNSRSLHTLEPVFHKRGSQTTTKSSPRSPQLEESPCAATKTQHSLQLIKGF